MNAKREGKVVGRVGGRGKRGARGRANRQVRGRERYRLRRPGKGVGQEPLAVLRVCLASTFLRKKRRGKETIAEEDEGEGLVMTKREKTVK